MVMLDQETSGRPADQAACNQAECSGGQMCIRDRHSDILNRFAALSHEEQERYIDGSREVESRQEMKNYVENMFRG